MLRVLLVPFSVLEKPQIKYFSAFQQLNSCLVVSPQQVKRGETLPRLGVFFFVCFCLFDFFSFLLFSRFCGFCYFCLCSFFFFSDKIMLLHIASAASIQLYSLPPYELFPGPNLQYLFKNAHLLKLILTMIRTAISSVVYLICELIFTRVFYDMT